MRPLLNLLAACFILISMRPVSALSQKVKVGEPAPDFSVPSLDGKMAIRLSDLRGRRVLIFTWASW